MGRPDIGAFLRRISSGSIPDCSPSGCLAGLQLVFRRAMEREDKGSNLATKRSDISWHMLRLRRMIDFRQEHHREPTGALESLGTLTKYNVALVSITENIDYSTP